MNQPNIDHLAACITHLAYVVTASAAGIMICLICLLPSKKRKP